MNEFANEKLFFLLLISSRDVLKEKGINMELYLPNKVILCKTILSHSCPSPLDPGLQEQM